LEATCPSATHRIRYEDLAASPDTAVRGVLAFLGAMITRPGHERPLRRGNPAARIGNF
jgi:hypothetical protein